MTEIRLQNPYMDETIKVKENYKLVRDMIIVYYDGMEDSEHVFSNKNDAINELHRLRDVKYRNARKYKVEMAECDE